MKAPTRVFPKPIKTLPNNDLSGGRVSGGPTRASIGQGRGTASAANPAAPVSELDRWGAQLERLRVGLVVKVETTEDRESLKAYNTSLVMVCDALRAYREMKAKELRG